MAPWLRAQRCRFRRRAPLKEPTRYRSASPWRSRPSSSCGRYDERCGATIQMRWLRLYNHKIEPYKLAVHSRRVVELWCRPCVKSRMLLYIGRVSPLCLWNPNPHTTFAPFEAAVHSSFPTRYGFTERFIALSRDRELDCLGSQNGGYPRRGAR